MANHPQSHHSTLHLNHPRPKGPLALLFLAVWNGNEATHIDWSGHGYYRRSIWGEQVLISSLCLRD